MQWHQARSNRTPKELMRDNLIVKHYAGSHAYGTSLPTSDVDIRGVFAADPINIRTPWFIVRETEVTEDDDTKLYELTHFMKLCLGCNPNIIETLWIDLDDIIQGSDIYCTLRNSRDKLLSKKIAHTTFGYAMDQLKRIRGHNKWLNKPQPVEPPRPYQHLSMLQWFGEGKMLRLDLDMFRQDYRLVPYGNDVFGVYHQVGYRLFDDEGNLNATFEGERSQLGSPVMLLKWNKAEYKLAQQQHQQYWTWKRNRNAARGELEEEFGYDTKNAMHLVRLLRMGKEALTEGVIKVKRPDADELLAIRNGAWTYEQVVEYAEDMDNEIHNKLYQTSDLPKRPDIKFAANLLMHLQDRVWAKQSEDA